MTTFGITEKLTEAATNRAVPSGPRKTFWDVPAPHADPQVERLYRKQRLAGAFRLFARRGYDYGIAGHLTARDPERTDHFWVNPVGIPFAQIRVSDLVEVGPDGQVLDEGQVIIPAAFRFHGAVFEARPDVVASFHTHSTAGKIWSSLGRLIDPLTQDSAAFFEDHVLYDARQFLAGQIERGERINQLGSTARPLTDEHRHIATVLGHRKAVILQNHGLLTVGQSVEAAAWWFIALDNAADAQLRAEAVGKPIPLPDDQARFYASLMGSPKSGWLFFQPLWQWIVREEPDLLD
jgi:Ribulose-5-phosphate 4-epimerase and related epimerases and aldolases